MAPPPGSAPGYPAMNYGTPMTPTMGMPTMPSSSAPSYGSPAGPAAMDATESMWKRQKMTDGRLQWTEVTPDV